MNSKIFSFIAATVLIGSMSTTVSAYEEAYNCDGVVALCNSVGIMPYYDNVGYVASGIDINSSNKAICTSSYVLYSGKKSVVTMTLMKSSDGVSNWTAVESWSKTYNVQNPAAFNKTSTNALSSSYYYRNLVMVQIYDNSGNVIETVSAFSNPTHL